MLGRHYPFRAAPGAAALPIHAVRPATLDAWLGTLDAPAAAFLRASGFTAAANQVALLPGADGLSGAALGLGTAAGHDAFGALPMALPEGTAWRILPGDVDEDAAVTAFCLGAYQFTELAAPRRAPAALAFDGDVPGIARAAFLARDLINRPANLLGPSDLADAALALAAEYGATATRTEGDALAAAYPTIAAVGAGSARPPVVARFTWSGPGAPADAPLVALCGKGVVFDTGGYDLKPSAAMLRMKKDMGGAALILAVAAAIMDAGLPIRLDVRTGCVENMVSDRAMRPLDVVRTRKGLTVEIGNTDAEGRLVLCDLLDEACDSAPDLLVDAATLTGAARVALGPDIPALFCNDDAVADAMHRAGMETEDPVWRLPLWPGYDPWLTSTVADLNNVSSRPMAGSIVAALFLQRFVRPGTRWAHVDTYAWNDGTRPARPEGGEALGLRMLFNAIRSVTHC